MYKNVYNVYHYHVIIIYVWIYTLIIYSNFQLLNCVKKSFDPFNLFRMYR